MTKDDVFPALVIGLLHGGRAFTWEFSGLQNMDEVMDQYLEAKWFAVNIKFT